MVPVSPEEALAAAATGVRRDLERTGRCRRRALRALEESLAHRQWWVSAWPEGADHLPGLVAQDVQEAVQAQLDAHWPPCPEHRDHALFVEPDLGPDAFWVCHRTGLPVATIGGL